MKEVLSQIKKLLLNKAIIMIFINILGYKIKPNNEWTFKPQPSTIIGQHPDAILSNSDDNNVFAVMNLKVRTYH